MSHLLFERSDTMSLSVDLKHSILVWLCDQGLKFKLMTSWRTKDIPATDDLHMVVAAIRTHALQFHFHGRRISSVQPLTGITHPFAWILSLKFESSIIALACLWNAAYDPDAQITYRLFRHLPSSSQLSSTRRINLITFSSESLCKKIHFPEVPVCLRNPVMPWVERF